MNPLKNSTLTGSNTLTGLIVICTFVVFYPTLQNGFFCWDDEAVALAPSIRQLTVAGVVNAFLTFHVGLYHPLTTISFMLDYRIGNGAAFPFHLTNLVLHIANTLLLFIFLSRITGNKVVSFITCLLFAVHPVHVESVAWITSRKDLLYTFFFLLSITFYSEYTEKRHKTLYYLLTLVCVLFALLSKIQAVSLPFVFLLIDYFKGRGWKIRTLMEKMPVFLLCLVFGIMNIIAQKEYGYITYGYSFSLTERAFLLIYSVSQYFIQILFPYPLSVFYPYPFKPGEVIPLASLISPALFLIGIPLLIHFGRKARRPVIFGILFFLFNILIVSVISFNRDAVIADRYNYLASAGILFIIAVLVSDLIEDQKRYRVLMIGLLVTVTVSISFLTFQRNLLWRDPEALFRQSLSNFGNSDIILNTLASREIESGKYEDAIRHLNRAMSLSPDYTDAHYNRGIAYEKTGDLDASVQDLTTAIRINPVYIDAWFARGNVYMRKNDMQQAFSDFTTVIRLDRSYFGAFQNRAIVRGNLGDYAGAIGDLDAAIALVPGNAASYYLKGVALFNIGDDGCAYLYKAYGMGYKDAARAIKFYCKPSP